MRSIPPTLIRGAMTLARCWRLTQTDGSVSGFTDHDADLVFDGVIHAAGTGLQAADMQAELGFAVTGGEVSGALNTPVLDEADIANGAYDGARVDLYLVDWAAPENRVLLESGVIGEIKRTDTGFIAEIRSLAYRLDEEQGRLFRPACSADLGDARCGVDLNRADLTLNGMVTASDGMTYLETSVPARAGLFERGLLRFTSGANAGARFEIRAQSAIATSTGFALWQAVGGPILPGDRFNVTAGCDKSIATCRDRFANLLNFRGFPHMVGNDFILASVSDGAPGMDGGSLFR